MYTSSKLELIRLICSNFNIAQGKPLESEIVTHKCLECNLIRDDFAGLDWDVVSNSVLKRNCSSLPFFTPKALRYYLPAFMVYYLRQDDLDCVESLVYELLPDSIDEYNSDRIDIFSENEKKIVVDFIERIKKDDTENYFDEEYDRVFGIWMQRTNQTGSE